MKEFKLPGLSAQLEEEAVEKQRKAAYKVSEVRKEAIEKQERIEDANFLQNSQVLEVLEEAAKLLEQGGHGSRLSVTNPNSSFTCNDCEDPIDLKLVWDVEAREDSHPLVGSDDYHGTVHSWKEANCRLVKDEQGKTTGLKFNVSPRESDPTPFPSALSLDNIVAAVDKAVTHPLQLDEEQPDGGSFPYAHDSSVKERRIDISFS